MLNEHLALYIQNTEDAKLNFNLGYEYEKLGQLAGAISFYLRSAERSLDNVLAKARITGRQINEPFAEAFMCVRNIV
jgi:hypothetical protein